MARRALRAVCWGCAPQDPGAGSASQVARSPRPGRAPRPPSPGRTPSLSASLFLLLGRGDAFQEDAISQKLVAPKNCLRGKERNPQRNAGCGGFYPCGQRGTRSERQSTARRATERGSGGRGRRPRVWWLSARCAPARYRKGPLVGAGRPLLPTASALNGPEPRRPGCARLADRRGPLGARATPFAWASPRDVPRPRLFLQEARGPVCPRPRRRRSGRGRRGPGPRAGTLVGPGPFSLCTAGPSPGGRSVGPARGACPGTAQGPCRDVQEPPEGKSGRAGCGGGRGSLGVSVAGPPRLPSPERQAVSPVRTCRPGRGAAANTAL